MLYEKTMLKKGLNIFISILLLSSLFAGIAGFPQQIHEYTTTDADFFTRMENTVFFLGEYSIYLIYFPTIPNAVRGLSILMI